MTAATAPAIPAGRRRARYENWRPPLIGVSLLVPVGADALVVADLRGSTLIPVGSVDEGQTPKQAAQHVLRGALRGLPLLRRVAVDGVQMRRRKVITHVLATAPMTPDAVASLTYRDPRADVRIRSTLQVIDQVTPKARLRILVGLQALATGETAYIEGGIVVSGVSPRLSV